MAKQKLEAVKDTPAAVVDGALAAEPKLNRADKRKAEKAQPAKKEYKTVLGKIVGAQFGFLGKDDTVIGLHLEFSFEGQGLYLDRYGGLVAEHQEGYKWTEEDRSALNADLVNYVVKTLREARVADVAGLVGRPVSATVETNFQSLKDWRVLSEVL